MPLATVLFTIHLYCCHFCLSQAITAMVQKAVDYIDLTLEIDTRIELIKTLSSVSVGKVRIFHLDDFLFLLRFLVFMCVI